MARKSKDAAEERSAEEDAAARARELLDVPEGERGFAPDLLRRLMAVGLSGLFTTEAALRGALGDTVPREWITFITAQSDRTRDEFISRLAQEFARVLENVDVVDLAEQLLAERTIEVKAEFKLGPRSKRAAHSSEPNGKD